MKQCLLLFMQNVDKWANIIAVEGDPLAGITVLEHVKFVMKDGTVYKNEMKSN